MNKRCSKCGEIKSVDKFNKNRSRKDGYKPWCKECNSIENRKYKIKNNPLPSQKQTPFLPPLVFPVQNEQHPEKRAADMGKVSDTRVEVAHSEE